MLGAIAGDIIGSVYEGSLSNSMPDDSALFGPYSRFTDDTVLTVAVAEALLHGRSYVSLLKEYAREYPTAGYGGTFIRWANSDDDAPYNSWGNGSAMRVSPVAYAFDTIEGVLVEAEKSAAVTHNHAEGIKGAKAIAAAVFLARTGKGREGIKTFVERTCGYNLDRSLDEIRPTYEFDVSCQGSVPQAIRAFLESTSFEDAVRKAISLGGDSDTIACMAGSIAEPFYAGVPESIRNRVFDRLDDRLRGIVNAFSVRYISAKTWGSLNVPDVELPLG
jgi:ADP-ribosylglycohydrolase